MSCESKRIILIVEDDIDIRQMLTHLFEGEGYQVLIADNGETALQVLKQGPKPTLILLDLFMPVMDAFGFRKIQEMDPTMSQIPVVLMSGDGQLDIKKMTIGIVRAVRKPIDIDSLLTTIEETIGEAKLEAGSTGGTL